MDKHFDFPNGERKWIDFFDKQVNNSNEPTYSTILPPPNVTGQLHVGHALNATIQDVLVRYYRSQGYNSLWVPGTDHGGIATQMVVEKELLKKGIKKGQLSRQELINEINKWKDVKQVMILDQIKRLGALCNWDCEEYTLNENFSHLVRERFCQLYNDGLIYKGAYIVNWCCRCYTALSDLEVDYIENMGKLYYIKYQIVQCNIYNTN